MTRQITQAWQRIAATMLLLMLSVSALANYDVHIKFLDIYSQPVSGLTVTAGGKTAVYSNGVYSISGLTEGTHTLSMTGDGYKGFTGTFEVGSNNRVKDFGSTYALLSENGYEFFGRVVDENSQGLAGVTVAANGKTGTSDASGNFVLKLDSAGSYNLTFTKEGYFSVPLNYPARAVSDATPRFALGNIQVISGYRVTGQVRNIENRGVQSATVTLGDKSVQTDGNGNFRIDGIKNTGTYTVKAVKDGLETDVSLNVHGSQAAYPTSPLYLVNSFIVMGYVRDVFDKAMQGITVEAAGSTAVTDEQGVYRLYVNTEGYHVVTVKTAGYKEVKATANYVSKTSAIASVPVVLYAISLTEGYNITGKVTVSDDQLNLPNTVSIRVDGVNGVFTPDEKGDFRIRGLSTEGTYNYTISVSEQGYLPITGSFSVNDRRPGYVVPVCGFYPNLQIQIKSSHDRFYQSDLGVVTFNVLIKNIGNAPAHYVEGRSTPDKMSPGFFLKSATVAKPGRNYPVTNIPEVLGLGAPNITNNQCAFIDNDRGYASCRFLGTIDARNEAQVDIEVGYVPGMFPASLQFGFEATGLACPGYCTVKQPIYAPPGNLNMPFVPYLSLDMVRNASSAMINRTITHTFTLKNSELAPLPATGVVLDIKLPELTTVESVTVGEGRGNCTQNGAILHCTLGTMAKNDAIPVTLTLKGVRVGQATIEYSYRSDQQETLQTGTSVFSIIPEPVASIVDSGNADLMLVVDDTGSMSEEIQGTRQALSAFISQGQAANIGLYTFKDNVTNRLRNNIGQELSSVSDMQYLLNAVNQLAASAGADCPEASLEALQAAKRHVKMGGRMVVITDASPHSKVNVDTLIAELRAQSIRVDVLLSGEECVGICGIQTGDSSSLSAIQTFSRIAHETGGVFLTPFEVNDGSTSGAEHYRLATLNLLSGAVKPTIISVSPNRLPAGVTADVRVKLANARFDDKADVDFGSNIETNTVTVLSPTELQVNLTVSGNASPQFVSASANVPQGEERVAASGTGVLEIVASTAGEVELLGLTPSVLQQGGSQTITLNVAGVAGQTLGLSAGASSGISISQVKMSNPTQWTAVVDLTQAQLGTHPLTLTINGQAQEASCSMVSSPLNSSVTVVPNDNASNTPRLVELTPNRGTQGSMRRLHVKGKNTTFAQDVSKMYFSGEHDIYVLDVKVINALELVALIQIDEKAILGYRDVFVYNDESQIFTLLDGFEVTPTCGYTLEGIISNAKGEAIAGVEIDSGENMAISDENGYYRLYGLCEGEYDLVIDDPSGGYEFDPTEVTVSDNTANSNGIVQLSLKDNSMGVIVKTRPNRWEMYQGETVRYTLNATNFGKTTATGLILTNRLPANTEVVSIDGLESVTGCSQNETEIICQLGDLATHQSATVVIVLRALGDQTIRNTVTVRSNEYGATVSDTWTKVLPYLSVSISDDPDPVLAGEIVFYEVAVELSQYVKEAGLSQTATGVTLVSQLPKSVEVQSVETAHGTCEAATIGTTPVTRCVLNDLSVAEASSLSRIVINMRVLVKEPGLLYFIHEATISANEFEPFTMRERTTTWVGEGTVDAAIVLDTTGSMQNEMSATVNALKEMLIEVDNLKLPVSPLVAFIGFKDEVVVHAVTSDLNLLASTLSKIKVEGGGTCPEASVEALIKVIPHVKRGGYIVFATDASPYSDADIEQLADLLAEKEITLISLLSGDCVDGTSWNDIAIE
ncbi:carboxypeptidase regulatory-like domain-containing protein [Thioflexithrix psekupsensis]|uniref:VWFA domain-containing protein n=1 Tax=Thioflexithrix psekupsensis TaxID=1570016 RepID=A0A251X8U9_9GAMM|nr:carboxypeptidase regulatory-like domain-containing protein [Thioflexithrix psekupsensis]OUD14401.1 hypothetical protein TPSD3_08815 [Thioflexithrix psekupsensis]